MYDTEDPVTSLLNQRFAVVKNLSGRDSDTNSIDGIASA